MSEAQQECAEEGEPEGRDHGSSSCYRTAAHILGQFARRAKGLVHAPPTPGVRNLIHLSALNPLVAAERQPQPQRDEEPADAAIEPPRKARVSHEAAGDPRR